MQNESEKPIEVDDLHKTFGSQVVLDGIALDAGAGETIAVMGRSGTGKSVLLKLLIGLQAPTSGSIRLLGRDIAGLPTSELNEIRKRVGFLFQQAALYDSLSLEQNVIFPMARNTRMPESEQKQKARDLLAGLGMEKDLEKLPSEISGGMQKRVGLARALALDPELLLCDEPTSGLDPITAAEIAGLIVDLKKSRKMTAIVVTHDVHGARVFADRALLLHKGKIVAQGSFDEVEKSEDSFVKQFFREAS